MDDEAHWQPARLKCIDALAPLLLFVIAATITPGGATTLVTASGAQFGFRRSIPLMAGRAAALTTLAVACSVGLASLLLAEPSLQTGVRVAGTVYLLWLAVKVARTGTPRAGVELSKLPSSSEAPAYSGSTQRRGR